MTTRTSKLLATLFSATLIGGCGGDQTTSDPSIDDDEIIEEETEEQIEGKGEAWDQANNPAYVDSTFVMEIERFPLQGKPSQQPWSGDYWGTYQDSLNKRWDGETSQSPAEKVAQAFNLPSFPKYITDNVGVGQTHLKQCDQTSDCADLKDGSQCVRARGVTGANTGRCVPTWWGICHGWAPAAIALPAPVKPVEHNGVTFYPGDLEGLGSFAYQDDLPVKFISRRCNREDESIGRDNAGRVREGECRDMNPGSLMVVLGNMLGLRKVSLVEDRTWDLQVWNQPVHEYRITNGENGKIKEITKADAIRLVGLGISFKELLAETTLAKAEKREGSHTATAAGKLTVKMTGSGDADLHVRKGSAATEAAYDCRPYGNDSNESCEIDVAAGEQVFWMISGYSDSSKVSLSVGAVDGTASYTYNQNAARFFHVEMDLDYITESHPARMSHIAEISNYVRTDHFSFIVETDQSGRVLGGEYLGASRTNHPDFMWWPTGAPTSNQGGLTYQMVKQLFDKSAQSSVGGGGNTGGGNTGGGAAPAVTVLAENVTMGSSSKYYTIGVAGGKKLTVKMTGTGTGNADLYIRSGARPTVFNHAAKSTNPGFDEQVSITTPAGSGATYYVRMRPRSGSGAFSITATVE